MAALAQRKEVMGRMQANLVGFTEEEVKLLQSAGHAPVAMSDADLINIMGETAADAEPVEGVEGLTSKASEIEASLMTAKGHAEALEAEVATLRK